MADFIEKKILKSGNGASPCEMCGFSNWAPGDVKYVIEHWMNDDSSKKGREHLCPSCIISRESLPFDEYYHQNKNAQIMRSKRARADASPTNSDAPPTKKAANNLERINNRQTNICQITNKVLQSQTIPSCLIRPHHKCSLFVAWNGVIVLVYEGFPPALKKAKELIKAQIPILKDENFGSKWPKTTLGAVNDDDGCTGDLTMDELQKLKRICLEHSNIIAARKFGIQIRTISSVEYASRGLESCYSPREVTMLDYHDSPYPDNGIEAAASMEDKAQVDNIVGEWDNLSTYLPKLNAPGSRISSYREKVPVGGGATCVAFLEAMPELLMSCLDNFKADIEKSFPARYSWLQPHSLHCTLRSLELKEDIIAEMTNQGHLASIEEAEKNLDDLRKAATKLGLPPCARDHIDRFNKLLQSSKSTSTTMFHLDGILHEHTKREEK